MHPALRSARRGPAAAFALALLAAAAPARAGVPDPRFSTVPPCIGVCPQGDESYSVVVRDVNNAPVAHVPVRLDLSGCASASVVLCGSCADSSGFNGAGSYFERLTDANGVATFQMCAEIACLGGARQWIHVSAAGILLANIGAVTPDVDLSLVVDAQDVALVTAAEGGTLFLGDEDCNNVIDAADVDFVKAHLGHLCPDNVPVLPSTWGKLKAGYR
jgi:hypothetical protein